MGLMKIKDYAAQEGISIQAVHKRIKSGGLKYKRVDKIKHIIIEEKEEGASTNYSTTIQPGINLSKLKKDNETLKQELNTLKVENAKLEERVNGKEEIIENLKEQHADIVKALGTNSEDLRKTIGTIRDLNQQQIETKLSHAEQRVEQEVETDVQPRLINGLIDWFNPIVVMTGLIVFVSITFSLVILYILGFKLG